MNRKLAYFHVVFALVVALVIVALLLSGCVISVSGGATPTARPGEQTNTLPETRASDNLSQFITNPCIVDGFPRILSFNNYGDSVNQKTIMYQRVDGAIVVVYIDKNVWGTNFHWATDILWTDSICPSE